MNNSRTKKEIRKKHASTQAICSHALLALKISIPRAAANYYGLDSMHEIQKTNGHTSSQCDI